MKEIIKVKRKDIDDSFKEFNHSEYSDYELNSKKPTHFISEYIEKGKMKGFDKITYFVKRLVIVIIFLVVIQ